MSVQISFVIPFYDEKETLAELVEGIAENVPFGRNHEVLLIDDGSTDGSGEEADRLARQRPEVRCIHLDGNFGKTAALACGFDRALGSIVFTMDADLQDDPGDIPKFLEKLESENLDVVSGWRRPRHDSRNKRILSWMYNSVMRVSSGISIHDFNCGFKCYRRDVGQSIPLFSDMHRFLPWLAKKCGFAKIGEVLVTHHPRSHGRGKYGFQRCFVALKDYLRVLLHSDFPEAESMLYRVRE